MYNHTLQYGLTAASFHQLRQPLIIVIHVQALLSLLLVFLNRFQNPFNPWISGESIRQGVPNPRIRALALKHPTPRHCILRKQKVSATFHHDGHLILQDPPRLIDLHPILPDILFAEIPMRRMRYLYAPAARLELVRTAEAIPVYRRQELGCRIAVEVWKAKGVRSDVPPRPEPEEVCQGSIRVVGAGRQDDVYRGVSVIDRRGVLGSEFCQVVLSPSRYH